MAVVRHPAIGGPDRPVVSVCIANYNGEHLLDDCIGSVLAQEGAASIEIIVHDDASSDASVSLLRERYPQVQVLQSTDNVGFCVANNRMAELARGAYLLLLNNDAALHSDAVAALLSETGKRNDGSILTLPQYDWQDGTLVDRGCMLDPFFNPIPNQDPAVSEVAYAIAACLFLRRDMWHSLGGLPEWMESLTEDLFLCGVARLRDVAIRALSTSGYRHRQGASFGGNRASAEGLNTSIRRRQLSECNKTRALIVLTPGLVVVPLLLAHLLALALEGLVLSALRLDIILWRKIYGPALAAPFHEAQILLLRRRKVQATRTISWRRWFSTIRWQLRKVMMLVRYGIPKVS